MKRILLLCTIYIVSQLHIEAQNSKTYMGSSNYSIAPITVNSPNSDFGPSIIDGILYFSSLSSEKRSKQNNNQYFDLFSIAMHETLDESAQRKSIDQLNADFHDGPVSYCETTGELFITRSDFENATTKNGLIRRKRVRLKIDIYQKNQSEWIFKEEFSFNNPNYSVGHPAINLTGDTLIFASDQPGGYGKTDLYLSIRIAGLWQEPQNLGPTINSKKNELTPFINTNGVLYFASNGHHGKGGLDIFSVRKLSTGQYDKPQNLGSPVNSKSNDYGFVLHYNQHIGYFVSNRQNQKRKDDIYCVKAPNYNFKFVPVDSAYQEIISKTASIQHQIDQYVDSLQNEKYISSNINYKVKMELINTDQIPDLKITFCYSLTNDTIRLGLNSYNLSRYIIEESNAAMVILKLLKKQLSNELDGYLKSEKRVTIYIHTNPDPLPVFDNIRYLGEYGELVKANCIIDDIKQTIEVAAHSNIDDQQLVFLRTYGIRRFMMEEITALKYTKNNFVHHILSFDQINKKEEVVKIEITIKNPFSNF